ncbi:hypothetical protein B0T25DRAFT_523546 [Lasiosphaeria hispida]|uniref:Uncharacterized protein n=1 Tax=Lasiosphaeria hispida TaxID=260671 RepID=A0AAJ0M7N7_9PEZI|nr:hypothetical protein B0T25DRAFT_523546 [Lasiosphaeria hispida]
MHSAIPVPSGAKEMFDRDIKGRLQRDLEEAKKQVERVIARGLGFRRADDWIMEEPALRMSGEATGGAAGSVILSPRIWICCSKRYRRQVKKALSHPFHNWAQNTEFGTIMVGDSAKLLARSEAITESSLGAGDMPSGSGIELSPGLSLHLEIEHVEPNIPISGLFCRATAMCDGVIISQKLSTIGGVIEVDGHQFGITTAHGMLDGVRDQLYQHIHPNQQGENLVDQGEYSDDESDSSSEGYNCYATYRRMPPAAGPKPRNISKWTPVGIGSVANFLGLKLVSSRMGDASNTKVCIDNALKSDFALLELGDARKTRTNGYNEDPGRPGAIGSVTAAAETNGLSSGPVKIVLGPRLVVSGTLLADGGCLNVLDVAMQTRIIDLDSPLAPGSSGAWVVRDNHLLGMILAGYESEPKAHMMPAHQLFSDIQDSIPQQQRRVSIAQPPEPENRTKSHAPESGCNTAKSGTMSAGVGIDSQSSDSDQESFSESDILDDDDGNNDNDDFGWSDNGGEFDDVHDIDRNNEEHCVRRFMRGLGHDKFQHSEAIEAVTSFCENLNMSNDREDQAPLYIAIVKSMSGVGASTRERFNSHIRRDSDLFGEIWDDRPDIERRMIYLPNLDASGIKVLASTASWQQREAVIGLFYRHLNPRASIDVTVTSRGFTCFTLDFHMPYYALRNHGMMKDHRQKPNGEPLRISSALDCLQGSSSSMPGKTWYLHQAQTSIVLTGISDRVWTAYGVTDTYYDPKSTDSVEWYGRKWKKSRDHVLRDPVSDNPSEPWLDRGPREYFLAAVNARLMKITLEWDRIVREMELIIEKRDRIPRWPEDREKAWRIKAEFSEWTQQILGMFEKLIPCLSEAIQIWVEFQRLDIGYFTNGGDDSDPSIAPSRQLHLTSIDKQFFRNKRALVALLAQKGRLERLDRAAMSPYSQSWLWRGELATGIESSPQRPDASTDLHPSSFAGDRG